MDTEEDRHHGLTHDQIMELPWSVGNTFTPRSARRSSLELLIGQPGDMDKKRPISLWFTTKVGKGQMIEVLKNLCHILVVKDHNVGVNTFGAHWNCREVFGRLR